MKSAIILFAFLIAGIFFSATVLADPQIQVTSTVSPTPVSPGSDGYVQLTLTNSGNAVANSIQITGVSSDPSIKVSSNAIGNLGALGNGQSTTAAVKFSVSGSAPSGLYTIRFAISICTSSCNEIDPTSVVTVQAPSALQIISIQPSILAAGQSATLDFNLMNTGNDGLSNIVLTWQTPNNEILPLGLSNRQFITSMGGGASVDLPINVSVGSSVAPGVYPLSVQLVYFDKSGVKQSINSTIGIKIGGTTDFDVSLQQYSAGTASLSIANIGVNPATSVSVLIPDQNNFAVSGANSVYLGNLNAGDFSVANFAVTSSRFTRGANGAPSNASSGSDLLTVQITYSDTSGGRQIAEKQIVLNLAASSSGTTFQRNRGLSFTTIIEIVAVIIVAAVVLLWFFKFRKKKTSLSHILGRKSGK